MLWVPALAVAACVACGVLGFFVGKATASSRARTISDERRDRDVEAQEQRARLLAALDVGIVILDRRGYVVASNPAAVDIFGFATRTIVGRAMIELVPSFDLDSRVRDALAGRPSRGPILLSAGAATRTLATLALPFEDGAIVVARDETEKTELERTRRDFVANVSHELRTPISSIKLIVETLLDAPDDPDARSLFLPQIKAEVDRLAALIEDLLELARAETGRLRLRRSRVDLAEVTQSALRSFESRSVDAGVALSSDLAPADVDADAVRVGQVVINLVDNALRHTSRGGRIDVRVERDVSGARLIVSDDGEGIPFNDLPHIFERFYVVERSRTRHAAGTGLGLSIVKQIVEAHGGNVDVDSELGIGSTFLCTFPLAPAVLSSS